MNPSLWKRPSALLPIGLSIASIALVTGFVILYGTQHQGEDEGAAAHIWQLLIAAHVPAIVFFLAKWMPRQPRQAAAVLVVQLAAFAAALSPIYLLGL